MSNIKRMALLSLLTAASFNSLATEINIDKSIVTFLGNAAEKKTITVFNRSSDRPAYIKATVKEVLEPHKGTKSKMLYHDTPKEAGLFVTPSRQIINAESDEVVSIINVNKNINKERVYRVDITPFISDLETVDPGQKVKILIAYDVLVYVQPSEPLFLFEHAFDNDSIYIKNTGNTHFTVKDSKACNKKGCTELPSGNLFSDQTSEIKLPDNTEYTTFTLSMEGKPSKRVKFER